MIRNKTVLFVVRVETNVLNKMKLHL